MSNVELDLDGIMQILNGTEAVSELRSRAGHTVEAGKASGPRGLHAGAHIIDKLAVGDIHQDSRNGPVVDIDWPDSRWHLVEYGSVHNPPYAVIRNAARTAGLTVIDQRTSNA